MNADLTRFAAPSVTPLTRLLEIFPNFIPADYPIFVAFLTAYYTWLQQSDQSTGMLATLETTLPTDIPAFLSHFQAQYLPFIPDSTQFNTAQLTYWIRELYQLRGTPLGFELFWQALYGADVDVLVPYDYTLKSSAGIWNAAQTLKCATVPTDMLLAGRTLVGETSTASAQIDSTARSIYQGLAYTELTVLPGTLLGTFQIGEWASTQDASPQIRVQLYGVLSSTTIVEPGNNYDIDDALQISRGAGQSEGSGAQAEVSRISSGGILNIVVQTPGLGYLLNDPVVITPTQRLAETIIPAIGRVTGISPGLIILEDGSNWLLDDDSGLLEHETINYTTGAIPDTPLAPYVSVLLGATSYGGSNTSDPLYRATLVSSLGLTRSSEVTPFIVNGVRTAYGQITDIAMSVVGAGYTRTPSITVQTRAATAWAAVPSSSQLQFTPASLTTDDLFGKILEVRIVDSGLQYEQNPTIDAGLVGGGNALIIAKVGPIGTYLGMFTNDFGWLSHRTLLQDDQMHHPWSYQLRTTQTIAGSRDFLKTVMHPAGTRVQHLQLLTNAANDGFLAVESDLYANTGDTSRTITFDSDLLTDIESSEQIDDVGIIDLVSTWANVSLQSTLTGTVAITNNSFVVLGTGTNFTGQMGMFDRVLIDGESRKVTFVANNTLFYVDSVFGVTATAQTCVRSFEGLSLPVERYHRTSIDLSPDDFTV